MDDERPVRKIAQAMLESLGYRVECAINGDEAIELYRGRLEEGTPFDVVIMDLTIPGGRGGKDAIRELLKIDPSARVIVSSGYSTDSVLADYRDHGFCAVLDKPYRLQELGEVMQEVHGATQDPPTTQEIHELIV
jgi:CheY-like chemotaxis protein